MLKFFTTLLFITTFSPFVIAKSTTKGKFTVSWKGLLKAGECNFLIIEEDSNKISAKITGKSAGIARLFWYYKLTYIGKSDVRNLKNWQIEIEEIERKKKNIYSTTLSREGVITKRTSLFLPSKTKAKKNDILKKNNLKSKVIRIKKSNVLEFLSLLYSIKDMKLEVGKKFTYFLYPFDKIYRVDLLVNKKTKKKWRNKQFPCYEVKILNILKRKKNGLYVKNNKFRTATMWILDARKKIPLEIRAKIFIGDIRVVLKEFEN